MLVASVANRDGVEDTRLKAKDTKKIRGQGQGHKIIRGQSQGQLFRGQTLWRPRTGLLEAKAKNTVASVLQIKKKGLQKSFQAISNS